MNTLQTLPAREFVLAADALEAQRVRVPDLPSQYYSPRTENLLVEFSRLQAERLLPAAEPQEQIEAPHEAEDVGDTAEIEDRSLVRFPTSAAVSEEEQNESPGAPPEAADDDPFLD